MSNDIFNITEETAWCPGCGNFPLRKALQRALEELELNYDDVAMFSGIGQAAKMPHYIKVNAFNGLHGRALPPALGFHIGNKDMKIIVESGDGDNYGEGGNHLLHNIRRNIDIAHFVHNNQIYGLTKGQGSPTTELDYKTNTQPFGVIHEPFNPISFGIIMKASFVARAYVGDEDHLVDLMKQAINHKGYALIDILDPCVSFNKLNTYQWYKKRVYKLGEDYDPTDKYAALKKAEEWGDKIPIGVIYKDEKETFMDKQRHLKEKNLLNATLEKEAFEEILAEFKQG